MAQDRLDLLLVRRGLVPSREQAKRLIMAGEVFVGDRKVTHPGWKLPPTLRSSFGNPPSLWAGVVSSSKVLSNTSAST